MSTTKENVIKSVGLIQVDNLLIKIAQAIEQKNVDKLSSLHLELKDLLAEAYKSNDPELYAYVLQNAVQFCIRAHQQNHLDKIAIILALSNEDLAILEKILNKKDYKLLTFIMVNHEYLEIFSELLKKDKKEIQGFKEAVYQKLAAAGQDCRPSEAEIVSNMESFESVFKECIQNLINPNVNTVVEFHWVSDALMGHLFFTKKPEFFARHLHAAANALIKIAQNKNLHAALNLYVNQDEDSLDIQHLLVEEFLPYAILAATSAFISRIARSNNVDTKILVTFKNQVLLEMEKLTNTTFEQEPENFIAEFQQVFLEKSATKSKKEGVKQIIKLHFLSQNYFGQGNVEKFSQIIFGISKNILGFLEKNELKDLQYIFIDALNADDIVDLALISKYKRLDLICYGILKSLVYDSDLALDNNMAPEAMRTFGDAVILELSRLNHFRLLRPLADIVDNVKSVLEQKEVASDDCKIICVEGLNQLHYAFEHKDAKRYANIVKSVVDILQHAYQERKMALLFTVLQVDLDVVADVADVLDNTDPSGLYKVFADFLLKESISEYSDEHAFIHQDLHKSETGAHDSKFKEYRAHIAFQIAVYKELKLPTESSKLGKIIVSPFEPVIFDLKDHTKTVREQLKAAFVSKQPQAFSKLIANLVSEMTTAFNQGRVDKAGQLLHRLSSSSMGFYVDAQEKTFNNEMMAVIFYLLEHADNPQCARLLNFALVDFIEYDTDFSSWNPEVQKNIVAFKGSVIDNLNDNNHLEPLERHKLNIRPEIVAALLKIYLRYWFLVDQNHPNQRKSRQGLQAIVDALVRATDDYQDSLKPKMIELERLVLCSTAYGSNISSEFNLSLISKPLLAWLLLNSTHHSGLDYTAKKNSISLENMNRFKSAVNLLLCDRLGIESLTPAFSLIQTKLEMELEKNMDFSEPSRFNVIMLEFESLLLEQICTLDHKAFANTIVALLADIKRLDKHLFMRVSLLQSSSEAFYDLMSIVNHGTKNLLARYFIQLIIKAQPFYYNIPADSFKSFIQETLNHINVLNSNSLDGNSNNPSIVEMVDFNASKMVDVVNEQNINSQKLNCLQLDLLLKIRDAYYFNNPKQFAHFIKTLCQLAQSLFESGSHQGLIQVLELVSDNKDKPKYLKFSPRANVLTPKITLENVIQSLEAGNMNGLTKLFIDAFVNTCSANILGTSIETSKFKLEVYDTLEIIPLDLLDIKSLAKETDINFLIASFRKLVNQNGVALDRYSHIFEAFAKLKSLVMALPKPDSSDSNNYRQTYEKILNIWHTHIVSHRFGITGSLLEGSYSLTMMQELQSAYQTFCRSNVKEPAFLAAKAIICPDMPQDKSDNLALQIQTDISNILLKPEEALNIRKINTDDRTIAMPLILGLDNGDGHLTSVIFFKFRNQNYCILTDKSCVINKSSGLEIHQVTHPEQIPMVISAIARVLENPLHLHLSVTEFKNAILPLGLELAKILPKKLQKSGNCGWSSSAKMCAFSLMFVNILKTQETIDISLDDAWELANKATNPIYKAFTMADMEDTLQAYFSYCEREKVTAHTLMLAQILLKSERNPTRQAIVELINSKITISDPDRLEARKALLESTIEFLLKKSKIKDPLKVDRATVESAAEDVLSAYLERKPEPLLQALVLEKVTLLQLAYPDLKTDNEDSDDKASDISDVPANSNNNNNNNNNRVLTFSRRNSDQETTVTQRSDNTITLVV
jgi:hypothetical protein